MTFQVAQFGRLELVQIRPSCLFAITIWLPCLGQCVSPLHAQTEGGSQPIASRSSETIEQRALPKCMERWFVDSHITKQEWLQACEGADAKEPSYNVDYARCLADWDPETHMTKSEWHESCARAVKEDPGAFEYRK